MISTGPGYSALSSLDASTYAPQIDASRYEFLAPLVKGWLGKIAEGERHKQGFQQTADECMKFFSGSVGFMWDPKFIGKYVKGNLSPKFKMTMCKAFELVALFGPTLYWRNPKRIVVPRKSVVLDPDNFEDLESLPPEDRMILLALMGQQQAQQFEQMQQQKSHAEQQDAVNKIRCKLLEAYLNFTPAEQPEGGLALAAERAITEALVKGRGTLWSETFSYPGSRRTLTGSFYDSVDNLIIDPDAESLEEARWIARKRVQDHTMVERRFGLPRNELRGRGSHASASSIGEMLGDPQDPYKTKRGVSHNLVTYYEVFSRNGAGNRLSGVSTPLDGAFDEVVGDYAWIVVSPSAPYPLNAPSFKIRPNGMSGGASNAEVRKMFEWPLPTWSDDRWPVSVLDFYQKPNSAWPVAPMAPGLGELIFLNVMMSHLSNRIWSSSRDFIAVMERAAKDVMEKIRSGDDQCIIPIKEAHGPIQDIVQFLTQPQTNLDVWRIIDAVSENFDKRVGLSEILYGMNPQGKMPRTATDVQARRATVNIRPDYMATKVESWMEHAAILEKFAARWFVRATDLHGLFGTAEMFLWDRYVTGEDVENVLRETRATVAAGSGRKPNHERDAQNINATVATILPILDKHADVTGDTSAVNEYIRIWGDAIEMDTDHLRLGPRAPAPDPQAMQMAHIELQKLAAETQGKELEAQIKAIELQIKQIEMQQGGTDLAGQQAEQELELVGQQAENMQSLEHDRNQHMLDMLQKRREGIIKLAQMQAEGEVKLDQQRQQGEIQAQAARAKARATPSSNGSSGSK